MTVSYLIFYIWSIYIRYAQFANDAKKYTLAKNSVISISIRAKISTS